MEKLPMCRICLVENVRMFVVNNRNLHELYEKLTDIPFVTEDRRPILACFFCCTKLKQCWRLLRKCLEAEEQFAQMMNEDYKPNPLINQDRLEFYSGFIKSPIEHISIVDECQTESIAIKVELPAVCEGLDDIIEPKEEHHSDEFESENLDNSCLDVAHILPHCSESDFIYDVPLIEFKTEVEEQEVSKRKGRVRETEKLELENLDNSCLDVADIPPHCSESDLEDDTPLMEFKIEVEEEGVSKRKGRVRETESASVKKSKLEDPVTAEQTKKEHSDSKVIRTTQKRTSKLGTHYKEPYKCDQRSFKQNINLTNHINIHTGKKLYKCDVCQHSFSRNSDLTKHIRTHTGEKPYKCDICQRSFNEKSTLKNHNRTHSGEKPFECDVCQRGFNQKGSLTNHIRIHTGEKPYKCDVCQRGFNQKGSLTNHIRIHTGEKPYKCDLCQRSFNQRSHLSKHIRIHPSINNV